MCYLFTPVIAFISHNAPTLTLVLTPEENSAVYKRRDVSLT